MFKMSFDTYLHGYDLKRMCTKAADLGLSHEIEETDDPDEVTLWVIGSREALFTFTRWYKFEVLLVPHDFEARDIEEYLVPA